MSHTWRRHPQCGHVALCDRPEGLSAIYDRDVNAVIWENAVPRDLQLLLEAVPHEASIPSGFTTYRACRWMEGAIRESCGNYEHESWHYALFDFLSSMCQYFAVATQSEYLGIDLRSEPPYREAKKVMADVAYFHRDIADFRMLVPLRGATTEWVSNDAPLTLVPRISEHPRYTAPAELIQQLPQYCAALFKGAHRSIGVPGFLHRSPQESSGWRSMLALTPVPDPRESSL